MNTLNRVVTILSAASLVAGCESITGAGNGDSGAKGKAISSSAQAQSAFALLKSSGESVDRLVPAPFNGSTALSGGTAMVSGRKSSSNTSSSSSSSTSRTSDLQISFANYASTLGAVSGSMRWFDYYYSRTACTSSFCSSASERSEAITGTSIRVQFVYNGETISDEITVDADSPDYTTRWNVKVTTRAGQVFTFSAY